MHHPIPNTIILLEGQFRVPTHFAFQAPSRVIFKNVHHLNTSVEYKCMGYSIIRIIGFAFYRIDEKHVPGAENCATQDHLVQHITGRFLPVKSETPSCLLIGHLSSYPKALADACYHC